MSDDRAVQLSVNVDHVATLRQARRAVYPDPVEAAGDAEAAGAAGITVHLRGDRRHIQDDDVAALVRTVQGKLNLEIAAEEEMIALALDWQPGQVTLVPERPDEVTTEGGLDLASQGDRVAAAIERLAAGGIAVSLFLDPDPAQVERLAALVAAGAPAAGFEINTDAYTKDPSAANLRAVEETAAAGAAAGLEVYAGHGLTTANVGAIAAIPAVEELNIGHWLISRSVRLGLGEAVREMLSAMAAGAQP
ncbi:MAG: pyridoxine 5'-phosphate synthase [Acidobacteriota bacterium]